MLQSFLENPLSIFLPDFLTCRGSVAPVRPWSPATSGEAMVESEDAGSGCLTIVAESWSRATSPDTGPDS